MRCQPILVKEDKVLDEKKLESLEGKERLQYLRKVFMP
jgi:hypothetical protein